MRTFRYAVRMRKINFGATRTVASETIVSRHNSLNAAIRSLTTALNARKYRECNSAVVLDHKTGLVASRNGARAGDWQADTLIPWASYGASNISQRADRQRYDLGAGYCLTVKPGDNGKRVATIGTHSLGSGMPGRALWTGDYDALKRVVRAVSASERKPRKPRYECERDGMGNRLDGTGELD